MDKSWISLGNRALPQYDAGVQAFLNFAFEKLGPDAKCKCPCKSCYLRYSKTRAEMYGHLLFKGFWETYTNWTLHGEKKRPREGDIGSAEANTSTRDDMIGMVNELIGVQHSDDGVREEQPQHEDHISDEGSPLKPNEGMDEETSKFFQMLEAATRPLFKGCKKFTSLSFVIRLLHIKVLGGMTNKCCSLILEFLNDAFEEIEDIQLPKSYYEARKIVDKLGFDYETWDACPKSCMLFWKEDKDLDKCKYCQESRYKEAKESGGGVISRKRKRIPRKQVRYFPLKPRLKRLFRSSHTASLMTWHADERVKDGVQRHPADSQAWKSFDERHSSFARESRNIRFGLAADGFNPYRTMSIAHSTWPVVLIPYNVPPWDCMKQHNFMLSVLIDGPKGPGQKIDVYLQPLINELKELWLEGVDAFDVYRNERFTLRAALLWTISDFPALGDLMGYGVRGDLACPSCFEETKSVWLKHSGKFCYWGHRRWLSKSHKFRKDKTSFDGRQEWGSRPRALTGTEILEHVEDIGTVYKEADILRKRTREEFEKEKAKERNAQLRREKRLKQGNDASNEKGAEKIKSGGYKKKSIFFELPYWEHNLIRHNLDVMHIEKNVCDNILFTLLGTKKTKDTWKSRLDLAEMNIRKPLHLRQSGSVGKLVMTPATFTMTRQEKAKFLTVLKNVRVPDGYASNISRCVNMDTLTISGLKSHDNHVLMQQLLPIALRKALPNMDVVEALIELSIFFRQLCSKMNKISDLEYIQDRIALTLSKLEIIFTPSFWNIMEHLPIHLAEEAKIAGLVTDRWMYPIERYLSTLKGYVRNQARPEGSIAKGYQMEECMTFCNRYLHDVETKSNRPSRNDSGNDIAGRHFGQATSFNLDNHTRDQIHRYVLSNTESIEPYKRIHLDFLKKIKPRSNDRELHRTHNEQFPKWLHDYVVQKTSLKEDVDCEIRDLALGPSMGAQRYKGYLVNGFRFRTKANDNNKASQNSGVALDATTRSYSSCNDGNPVYGAVTFYGQLTDIIEVKYMGRKKFVMFRCDWIDSRRGLRNDRYKFTSVNFNYLLYKDNKVTDEPFIFASQAEQVMYVEDPDDKDWNVCVRMTSRDSFDMGDNDESGSTLEVPQALPYANQQIGETLHDQEDGPNWVRTDVQEATIEDRSTRSSGRAQDELQNWLDNDSMEEDDIEDDAQEEGQEDTEDDLDEDMGFNDDETEEENDEANSHELDDMDSDR